MFRSIFLFFFLLIFSSSVFSAVEFTNGATSYLWCNGGFSSEFNTTTYSNIKNNSYSACASAAAGRAYRFSPSLNTSSDVICADWGRSDRYYCEYSTQPCDAPQVWNQTTMACQTPVSCVGQQTLSPDGLSCDDPVCSSGEVFNAVSKTCDLACFEPMIQNPFNGNTCEYPCPTTGSVKLSYNYNDGAPTCYGGCSLGADTQTVQVITGTGSTFGVFQQGGSFCDNGSSVISEECTDCTIDEGMTCPEGKVYGSFNGTTGCFDSAASAPSPVPPVATESTSTQTQTTVTNPDGSITTTTTTNTTSSSGSGSVTTVTTQNPDGSTTSLTTEQGTSGSLQGGAFDNSGAKSFWESVYPDGLSGVWASHQSSINNAPITQWLNSWSFGSGGSCPSFSFNFNFGFVNFGSQSISPDLFCYVFPIVRLILIISSLLLARRLVFGG